MLLCVTYIFVCPFVLKEFASPSPSPRIIPRGKSSSEEPDDDDLDQLRRQSSIRDRKKVFLCPPHPSSHRTGWKVMALIRWESIFVSLQHIIAPALDLMPCLPSQQRKEAINASNSRRKHEIAATKQRFLPQY